MSTISFPSYVATIARRIFNVVSTISISGHCYGLQDEKRRSRLQRPPGPFEESEMTTGRRDAFYEKLRESSPLRGAGVLAASTIPMPWLNRHWWGSIFATSGANGTNSVPHEPPPDHHRKREPNHEHRSRKPPEPEPIPVDAIHQLMMNPALVDPLRAPRYPIVLSHGLYGFDSRGPTSFPSFRMHYWATALSILRGIVGAEVIVTSVPGTGSIQERALRLDKQLREKAQGRGVNLLAHSMGGLDCRQLITHVKPSEYTPLSLTTISTPHRGSPFMDWCVDNIGIGKHQQQERQAAHTKSNEAGPSKGAESETQASTLSFSNLTSLPSSVTTLLLSIVDSPAYANLTTSYLNDVFNPTTPNDPNVKYFSVTSRASSVSILHPFWFTKLVVDGVEEKERAKLAAAYLSSGKGWTDPPPDGKLPVWADERQWGNDGLVTVQSAQWGEFLGILDNCDHWEMRGARGLEFGVDLPAIPALGLGKAPLPTSLDEPSTIPRSSPQGNSEAWYIGEWSRFIGGWGRGSEKPGEEPTSPKSAIGPDSMSPPPPSLSAEGRRRRQKDFTKGDQVVRSSTDKLSTMFDWIVDQVPNTEVLKLPAPPLSPSSEGRSNGASTKDAAAREDAIRKLGAQFVQQMIAGPASSSHRQPSAFPPLKLPQDAKPETLATEMKKIMAHEKKNWRKNELAKKADLERFYISLSRKLWDEGL